MVGSVESQRPSLTRERVVRGAVELADREGLEALTMRSLGSNLGVQAMSLYNYVANKEDLVDGMVDLIFAEIAGEQTRPIKARGNWRTVIRQRALSARRVLSQHPWAVGLLDSSMSPGSSTMRHFEDVLGSLRQAGFSIEMTVHAYGAVFAYVYGFVLAVEPSHHADQAQQIIESVGPSEYPYALEATDHFMRHPTDYTAEFVTGLDLILDGIERKLPTR